MTRRGWMAPHDQVVAAYKWIREKTGYAPSRNDRESARSQYWTEERDMKWFIGCANAPDHGALALILESARLLCGMERKSAVKVLEKALAEIKAVDGELTNLSERY